MPHVAGEVFVRRLPVAVNRVEENDAVQLVDEVVLAFAGELGNAIKLIENALKEARQGAFRVRNCRGFEKMCIPNRRRGTPPEKI